MLASSTSSSVTMVIVTVLFSQCGRNILFGGFYLDSIVEGGSSTRLAELETRLAFPLMGLGVRRAGRGGLNAPQGASAIR